MAITKNWASVIRSAILNARKDAATYGERDGGINAFCIWHMNISSKEFDVASNAYFTTWDKAIEKRRNSTSEDEWRTIVDNATYWSSDSEYREGYRKGQESVLASH